MRFRTKTILGIAAIEIVMLAILIGSVLVVLRESNEAELVRRVQLGGQLLATAAKDAVIAEDMATLDSLVAEVMASGQIDLVRIVDANGSVLARRDKPEFIDHPFHHDAIPEVDRGIYEWGTPIRAGGIGYGEVQIGVSTGPLLGLLASSQRWAVGIAGLELLLVALFSWVLGSYLARQLVALCTASEEIAAGNFAQQLAIKGNDELAQTALAFNHMTEQLNRSQALIRAENRLRVEAQEKLEQALASAEDRSRQLDAIFQLTPDGLVSFDRAGAVRSVNDAFLRMAGLTAAEVVGRPQVELEARLRERAEDPGRWPGLEPCFEKVGTGGAAPDKSRQMLFALHRPRTAVLELLGVSGDTASVSRLLYLHDVTHEVEVDRMKSEFLSHAAHELRTPMASIYGFSELLMSQEFDAPTRLDLLQTIHRQTAWLIEIINELLDLSRIEARQGKDFTIEPVALAPLVDDVLTAMRIDPTRWPVAIDLPANLPSVKADTAKLRQALTNVLSNAVKYSPKGGTIEVYSLTRTFTGKVEIGIVVTDHGIGMTPEQAARVGERFYRADNSGNIPGTGLGMTIVNEIIELLDGSMSVTCTPHDGTTVTLWLPVAANPQE